MKPLLKPARFIAGALVCAVAITIGLPQLLQAGSHLPSALVSDDVSGEFRTIHVLGAIDLDNGFFQSLGTNGRSCVTCHDPSDAWGLASAHVKARFDATLGMDPLFRANDGSTSPLADVSTVEARRAAYKMLLTKGLIRVGIGVPAGAEFELVSVDDPYGYASTTELSLFRRPLPTTNLAFLSAVMWDGRETFAGESMHFDLSDQANGATLGHAAGINPLTPAQRNSIANFELGLYTAQDYDNAAGNLDAHGANGGPKALAKQNFFIGINDVFSLGFNPSVFTLFDAWDARHGSSNDPTMSARAAIARGQEIFNTRPIAISGVNGLNDKLGVTQLNGTCSTCHDAPNGGDHSVSLPVDIGIASADRRTPDMPLYTFRNNTTGAEVSTTDPGRALITGKWKDMSLFKGPILRGLAGRAPYFHDGSAATIQEAINFYDARFNLALTTQEKADLAAFLLAL
jgi:cytochrome c peroxidase